MPRKPRLEFPGACFHVINRGNYRRDLFHLPGSAEAFERTLFEACQTYAWRLHAFVIMRNHFHLALELSAPTLSTGMKWLQGTWSARFNRFHGQIGRPFQGRFKASLVQPGPAFARVVDYIHLNPVRANLVRPEDLATVRFSSLWHFRRTNRPPCLTPVTALSGAGGLEDTSSGWHTYCETLRSVANSCGDELKKIYAELRRGWCIGSELYKAEMKVRAQAANAQPDDKPPRNITTDAWNANREDDWEQTLQLAAQSNGIELTALPEKKSAFEKITLALQMRTTTSATNVWLARRLQMGGPGSLSQILHRHRLSLFHKAG